MKKVVLEAREFLSPLSWLNFKEKSGLTSGGTTICFYSCLNWGWERNLNYTSQHMSECFTLIFSLLSARIFHLINMSSLSDILQLTYLIFSNISLLKAVFKNTWFCLHIKQFQDKRTPFILFCLNSLANKHLEHRDYISHVDSCWGCNG